jgi:hypothetical protein
MVLIHLKIAATLAIRQDEQSDHLRLLNMQVLSQPVLITTTIWLLLKIPAQAAKQAL